LEDTLATVVTEPDVMLGRARDALKRGNKRDALLAALTGLRFELNPLQGSELNRIAAEVLLKTEGLFRAKEHAKKARAFAIASGDYLNIYHSAMTLGQVFARMNNYAAAYTAWTEALTFAGMNGDTIQEGQALLNMAILDQRRGKHTRALDILGKVHARFSETDKSRLLARCYSRMIFSYLEENQIQKALDASHHLERLARDLNDINLEAIALFRRGTVYMKLEKHQKAIALLDESKELFLDLEDMKNVAVVLYHIARVMIDLKEKSQAEKLLRDAAEIAGQVGSEDVICSVKISYIYLDLLKDDWQQARQRFEEIFAILDKISNEDRLREIHCSLTTIIKNHGVKLPGLANIITRARSNYLLLGLRREAQEAARWLSRIS
jgi:tetratricopeptide (TPR) repeat protein